MLKQGVGNSINTHRDTYLKICHEIKVCGYTCTISPSAWRRLGGPNPATRLDDYHYLPMARASLGISYGATSVEAANSPVLSDEDTDSTEPMLISVGMKIICPNEKRTDRP